MIRSYQLSGRCALMLSLEVVGVLLGVLPILFKAVDLSKDGI